MNDFNITIENKTLYHNFKFEPISIRDRVLFKGDTEHLIPHGKNRKITATLAQKPYNGLCIITFNTPENENKTSGFVIFNIKIREDGSPYVMVRETTPVFVVNQLESYKLKLSFDNLDEATHIIEGNNITIKLHGRFSKNEEEELLEIAEAK